jgi:hypothetical protein
MAINILPNPSPVKTGFSCSLKPGDYQKITFDSPQQYHHIYGYC